MENTRKTVSYYPKVLISKDELIALQTRRMKHTLLRAYSFVPYYKKKWDDHGVHPDDFTFLEDIEKFPFTTKDMFWDMIVFNGKTKPEQIDITNPQDEMIRVYNTEIK